MAELGAVITIIELVVLSGKVLSSCHEYIGKVREAPKEIQRVMSEIAVLKAILDHLKTLASNADDGRLRNLRVLEAPNGPFETCFTVLQELNTKTVAITKATVVRRRLLWPVEGPKLEELLGKLERQKTTFIAALTGTVLDVNIDVNDRVENVRSQLDEMRLSKQRENVLEWLNGPDPVANHNAARQKHEQGTGDWLLASDHVGEWKSGNRKILWLYGIPGAGKTILSSTVIDSLAAECKKENNRRVVYYYFDFNDHQRQTTISCIQSLVRQLCEQSEVIPEVLLELFSDCRGASPSLEKLVSVLTSMLGDDFIVIDALDECQEVADEKERTAFYDILKELVSATNNCRIFITSRPEPDIKLEMTELDAILLDTERGKVDEDIRVCVRATLVKDKRLRKWPQRVKDEIETNLMEKANGMFRWAVCQLDSLRGRLKLADIRKELSNLPRTLEETYRRIFGKIPQGYDREIRAILILLAFSARPMTISEIAEATAINLEKQSFSKDDRFFDPFDILELCSSLVSETQIRNERAGFSGWPSERVLRGLQFAHFSVKEYILSDAGQKDMPVDLRINSALGHRLLTENCLLYLLDFNGGEKAIDFDHREFPLLSYATMHWTTHLALVPESDRGQINIILGRLFDPDDMNHLINYLNLYNPLSFRNRDGNQSGKVFLEYSTSHQNKQDFETPLYYACYYGIIPVVEALIGNRNKNTQSMENLGSALEAAASKGHADVIQLLLMQGADPNSPYCHQFYRPLQAAAAGGSVDAVELLLKAGANAKAVGCEIGTALHAAAESGNPKVIQTLINHGVDVDLSIQTYGTAISTAANSGKDDAVSVLLKNGANPNIHGGNYETTLRAACKFCTVDSVKNLLDAGAKISPDPGWNKALCDAAERGDLQILKLLIARGAEVNAKGGTYGTPLKCAIQSRDDAVFQFMLDSGADINFCGSGTKFPVDQAIFGGNLEAANKLIALGAHFGKEALKEALGYHNREYLVKTLLDHGADPNEEDDRYGNMLQLAVTSRCREETIVWLLDAGADINAVEGESGTALQAAIEYEQSNIISLLLDHGAELNPPPCGDNGTPLQAAIRMKNEKVARLLIERGADVNSKGGRYGTPLGAAVATQLESIVLLLIDKGADINSIGGEYGSSLRAALAFGDENLTRILLKNGADLNLAVTATHHTVEDTWRSKTFSSSIEVAAASNNTHLVQLILDTGLDLLANKELCVAVLQNAASCSGIAMVEFLITKGVNIESCGGRALLTAVERNDMPKVELLIQQRANVNEVGEKSGGTLQASIDRYRWNKKQWDIFQLLLGAGADVSLPGGDYGSPLGKAIQTGSKQMTMELLRQNADVNVMAGGWGTALMIAISKGDDDLFHELLNRGADINASYGYYGTALDVAISRGYYDMANELLDKGADVNPKGFHDRALIAASQNKGAGLLELIRRLVSLGCDLDAVDQPRPESKIIIAEPILFSALQCAAYLNNEPVVRLLLELGADLNGQGGTYGTALQAACNMKHVEMAELLLAQGAEINTVAGRYGTALQAATNEGSAIVVTLLLKHGADVNVEGGEYGTALQAAWQTGLVRRFLELGAAVNTNCGKYGNPLQAAANRGNLEAIKLLLDHGADINLPGGQYGFPLQAAACTDNSWAEQIECMEFLLAQGADVNAVGGEYGTALQAAAYHHKPYVEILLKHGANPNVQGGKYGNALKAAKEKDWKRVVKLLMKYGATDDGEGV